MKPLTVALAAALLAAAAPAWAATVTITVKGVRSDKGDVVGRLCDQASQFPSGACPYRVHVKARPGPVDLRFDDVAPGTYAFSGFHDENGDGAPQIPQEGYVFGGDQPYPPSFQAAALHVETTAAQTVTMVYGFGPGAQPAAGNGVPAPAGVIKTDVRDHGLYAELYAPTGARKGPAIIAIGGSEGALDTMSLLAAPLAQKGYTVLVLAYWRAPGLPQGITDIPLEYFKSAIDWLKTRPEADPTRIGMIGWSYGANGALLAASTYKDIKAVCAVAPVADMMQGFDPVTGWKGSAWTLGGKPLPYHRVSDRGGQMLADPSKVTRAEFDRDFLVGGRDPAAAVPVERINGPILMLAGGDDHVWMSAFSADQISERLKAHHFRHDYRTRVYPGAGHAVFVGGPGDTQNFNSLNSFMGGNPTANAAAWADSWPRTVAFFDAALKRKTSR